MMPPITYIDEPNMIIPLAVSYNTRGLTGYTQAVTNARDQRKVNCVYEPVVNAVTNRTSLYVAKRPGVIDTGSSYGTSSQTAYLWEVAVGASTDGSADSVLQRWVFSHDGASTNSVSNTLTTIAITTQALYQPAYVDKTLISGVETMVLQLHAGVGSGSHRVFFSSTIATWTRISDADFPGEIGNATGKMEFLDGYGLIATTTNRIANSDLNSLSNWSAAGNIQRSSKLDRGTGLARLGPQIISFGSASFEVFRNAGTAFGSPLEAVPSLAQDYGLSAPQAVGRRHYYAILDGRLYWRGSNPDGVLTYNGATVEKVSTPAIDKILSERGYFFIGAVAFQGKRAIAIGLTTPQQTPSESLLFFPEWKDWFEWTSGVFIPQTSPRRMDVCMGGSGNAHKLFQIATSTSVWRDAGTDYTMTQQFKLPTNGNSHQRLQMFGVKGDTAASTTTSNLNVRFSFDDWQTSTAARTIDLTQAQKRITRCGGYRDLGVYLDHTANLDCRLEAVVARVE